MKLHRLTQKEYMVKLSQRGYTGCNQQSVSPLPKSQ